MVGTREDVEETARWEADKERRTSVIAVSDYADLIARAERTCNCLRRLASAMDHSDFDGGGMERDVAALINELVTALRDDS